MRLLFFAGSLKDKAQQNLCKSVIQAPAAAARKFA